MDTALRRVKKISGTVESELVSIVERSSVGDAREVAKAIYDVVPNRFADSCRFEIGVSSDRKIHAGLTAKREAVYVRVQRGNRQRLYVFYPVSQAGVDEWHGRTESNIRRARLDFLYGERLRMG